MVLGLLLQLLLMTSTETSPVPMRKTFPTAIIVGVKKAGTRALLEFLRLNPNIRAPGPEVHFFDKNYHKGLDWYRYEGDTQSRPNEI
ncbi:hypothetical protein TELCIR_18249 [Teladorsagia circumcincta]|uniref:Sulfotransferase domain-containing protein n=1 Tax=Teladorsagia circumcincta TaxID=45464 RepID=A0A2G9TQI1_TELCI|nr:hypothetical protein TELCIR_18249 [Teladorsagia circumcincta]